MPQKFPAVSGSGVYFHRDMRQTFFMRWGRLMALIIISIVIFTNLNKTRQVLGHLVNFKPEMQTQMDLMTYSGGLVNYYASNDSYPEDIPAWLKDEFTTKENPHPECDRFGTPYRTDWPPGKMWVLYSVGADKKPGTGDDIRTEIPVKP